MGSSFADLSEVANGSSKDATAQTFNTIILVIQIVATVAVLFVIGKLLGRVLNLLITLFVAGIGYEIALLMHSSS